MNKPLLIQVLGEYGFPAFMLLVVWGFVIWVIKNHQKERQEWRNDMIRDSEIHRAELIKVNQVLERNNIAMLETQRETREALTKLTAVVETFTSVWHK